MNRSAEKKLEEIIAALAKSKVEHLELVKEVRQSFLDYSMSVITARSLPDVRDGLKPIHRRILYTAFIDGLTSDKKYKKCATLVGAVMGSFHPHGDSSIYEALVRLAQDFSMRYPLIDGQGNFGSIDGDGAAAMRYTECKLAKIGDLFLENIKENTVDFVPNFDGSKLEPVVLPSPVPNILINGAQGIAVGMATNIPPHNLNEVCNAILALLANSDLSDAELSQYIKGPDFPTGGEIHDVDGIHKYLTTGTGGFYNRGKVEIIKQSKNNNNNDLLIIKEIPYSLKKNNLIDKIVRLAKPGKNDPIIKEIDGNIADIRDESSREGIRLLIELKKGVNPDLVLNALYRHSYLQVRFSANLTMLVDQTPKVMGVLDILRKYVEFQLQVLVRKCQFNLEKITKRIHILEGREIIAQDILEVVRIIAEEDDAEAALSNKYHLSAVQIEDILAQPLRSIRKIERNKLAQELSENRQEKAELEALLASEAKQKQVISERVLAMKNKFGDARRTIVYSNSAGKIANEYLIPKEDVVITLSEKNYLKSTPLKSYKIHKRGGVGVIGAKTYEDDNVKMLLSCNSHDNLLFFSSKGKVYRLKAYHIASTDRVSKGKPVNLIIPKLEKQEVILTILVDDSDKMDKSILFATEKGYVKKTLSIHYRNININGKRAITIDDNDQLVSVLYVGEVDQILLAGSNGKLVRFASNQLRNIGRIARGVHGMKLGTNERLVSASSSAEGDFVFSISQKGVGKITEITDFRLTKRNGKGVITQKINAKTGDILMSMVVNGTEDILLLSNKARINRFNISDFSAKGRASSGVILFRVDEAVNEVLIYAAKSQHVENDEVIDDEAIVAETNQSNEEEVVVLENTMTDED